MIYQRHMPAEELIAAQLELLLQSGRLPTFSMHLLGVLVAVTVFWPFLPLTMLLLWAVGFLTLLLLRSLQMSRALVERRYQTHSQRVYWQLLIGAVLTGGIWSSSYIFAAQHVPVTMQHVFLLLIIMITAFSLAFSVAVREYFIVYMFASLLPIAWWSLIHYWDQPYNLPIGLVLLAFCALMIYVSDQTYLAMRNMISLTWEREQTARELGGLTQSLRDRNRQLRDARRQLTELANIDELTGLGNRRLANSVLKDEINRARRTGSVLSLILLDVDYFKSYNDSYGHPEGDKVLQQLADIMVRATTRAGELVARYGGEEFLLVLPGATAASALRTAKRLREMIAQEKIPHATSAVAAYLTISQGVVTMRSGADQEPIHLIKLADDALYRAKDEGRNTITVAE